MLTLLSVGLASAQQASVRSGLLQRSIQRSSAVLNMQEQSLCNPALRFYVWDFSHTQMEAGISDYREDEAVVQQLGDGRKQYGLNISSLLTPAPNSRAWGDVYYDYVDRKGINMNLSSDYDRIYPYITADTLGPAGLKAETYSFAGGYARQYGNRYLFGISASTRNLQEYRQKDPRPRTRVSDIDIMLGGGYKLPVGYALGLSAGFASYKQANSVTMLSNEALKISTPFYSMTGLGTALSMANNETSFTYAGRTWTAALDAYPTQQRGWIAHIGYSFDDMHKTIGILSGSASSMNTADQQKGSPINDILTMQEDRWQARLGWMDHADLHKWSVQAAYAYRHRIGSEILLASTLQENAAIATNLTNMGMQPYYQEDITQWRLDAVYEKGGGRRWHVKPYIGYHTNSTGYYDPVRSLRYERLSYGAEFGLSRLYKQHLLQLIVAGGYDRALSSDIDISNVFEEIDPNSTLSYGWLNRFGSAVEMANYRFLSTDNSYIKASARWEWQLFSNKSLFLQPTYQQGWYTDKIKSSYWQVKVGMVL